MAVFPDGVWNLQACVVALTSHFQIFFRLKKLPLKVLCFHYPLFSFLKHLKASLARAIFDSWVVSRCPLEFRYEQLIL